MGKLIWPMVVFWCGALLLVGSCGNGKSKPAIMASATEGVDTPSITPQAVPTSNDSLLSQSLLTGSDLDGTWSQQSLQNGFTVAENNYCGRTTKSFPLSAFALFTSLSRSSPRLLIEAFSKFDDAASASEAFRRERDAHQGCDDWVSTDGAQKTEWHTESFGATDIGDEAVVEKASAQLEGLGPSESYQFLVRHREILMTVAVTSAGTLDSAEPMDIVRAAYAKFLRVTGSP